MLTLLLASPTLAADCRMAPLVVAEALDSEKLDDDCATLDLDLGGRFFSRFPENGLSRGVALQRFRTEIGLRATSDIQTRVAFLATQTGGPAGYVGVDGEAIVPILQIAEARWDWRTTGFAFAAGLIDDVWVMTIQPVWGRIEIARPLATDRGWMARADAGGFASWTAPGGVASVTASATTGQGFKARELNNGTNVTGVLHLRPLAASEAPLALELAVMAREGSFGMGRAPDHRAGAAVLVRHDVVVGGVDALLGWGLAGDGEQRPGGVSAWARTGPSVPAVGLVRFDTGTDDRTVPDTGESLFLAAAGPQLPLRREGGPGYLVVGWESRSPDPGGASVAGAPQRTDLVFVQLGARLMGALPLQRF